MSDREIVTANITLDLESHRRLRMLASKNDLTNSEVMCGLLTALNTEDAEELLQPAIKNKKANSMLKKRASKEVEALSPERVRELLALLKK